MKVTIYIIYIAETHKKNSHHTNMCYDLSHSRFVENLLSDQLIFYLSHYAVFAFCLLQFYYVLLLYTELYGFNQAINRHNKIAIGSKQTRPFAINKVSIDAIIIFLHSESGTNHNTCFYGKKF